MNVLLIVIVIMSWCGFVRSWLHHYIWPTQSDGRGQAQPHQHHRVQGAGRVERHAGVHLQQRRDQSHRHGQAGRHQEAAAHSGAAGQDGVQVRHTRPSHPSTHPRLANSPDTDFFFFFLQAFVAACDQGPEGRKHRRGHGAQTPTGGAAAGRGEAESGRQQTLDAQVLHERGKTSKKKNKTSLYS